jgi:hypothetical protein
MFIDVHLGVPGYGPTAALKPIVTQVDTDGSFTFEVRPQVTVDIQAVLREDGRATGSSPVARLTIRSLQNLSLRAVTATRGRFVLTTVGPSFIPLASGNIKPRTGEGHIGYLYLVAKNGRTALRIGSGRVRDGACPALCKRSAIGYFHISRSIAREKRNFIACARGPMFLAIQDAAVSPDCGKTSIRLRKAT